MVKKQTIGIIIILISVLLIMGGLFILFKPFGGAVVTTTNYAKCPEDNVCTAVPILSCTTPSSQPVVTLRCFSGAFAILKSPSDQLLTYFCKNEHSIYYTPPTFDNNKNILCPENIYKYSSDGKYLIFSNYYDAGRNYAYYDAWVPCAGVSQSLLTTTPLQGYHEETNIGSGYNCKEPVYVDNVKVGEVTNPNPALANSNIRGQSIALQGGQTITFNGQIELTSSATKCQFDGYGSLGIGSKVCYNNKVLSCNIGPQVNTEDCGSTNKCNPTTLKCEPPYTISLLLNGNTPSSITTLLSGDDLVVAFTFNEVTPQPRIVVVQLTDLSGVEKASQNSYVDATQKTATITIPPLPAGEYNLKIKIDSLGYTSSPLIVRWTSGLAMSIIPGPNRYTPQYSSDPIIIRVLTFVDNTQKDVAGFPLYKATFNDIPVTITNYGNKIDPGTYDYYFNLQGRGSGTLLFQARAQVTSNSPFTDWTSPKSFAVEPGEIKVSSIYLIGSSLSKSGLSGGTYTIGFDTSDSYTSPLDTNNVVIIKAPSGKITDEVRPAVTKVATGKYTFQATFSQIGAYIVTIQSSDSGSAKSYTETFSVTSGGIEKTCTEDPNQEKCKVPPTPDYTLYIIGAVLLAVIIFVAIKVKGGKRK